MRSEKPYATIVIPVDANELLENSRSDGYSDRAEDADAFVVVPETDGLLDFGHISQELADVAEMEPLPIRMTNGRHFSAGGGYGVIHIWWHHGPMMANFEYYSIQDFVFEVTQDFSAVYLGQKGRQLIVRRKDKNLRLDRVLVLEMAGSKDYYSIVTAYPVSAGRKINGTLIAERVEKNGVMVWECRAPHSKGPGGPGPTSTAS